MLHGKIDILRAELVGAAARRQGGGACSTQVDVESPDRILTGKAPPQRRAVSSMSHVYCPECGYQNPEAANYCSQCGALLVTDEPGSETTMSFTPDDDGEDALADARASSASEGPALVVRSGGGRAGEHFVPQGERTTIGRSPDCDIFLDDVTVSRKHAVLVSADGDASRRRPGQPQRHVREPPARSSPAQLEDGDELQIGKYRLTFLER